MGKEHVDAQMENLSPEKKAMVNRLRRVEGQLRGIQRLIAGGSPCEMVLIQLAAARKALQNACLEILRRNIHTCIARKDEMAAHDLDRLLSALLEMAPPCGEEHCEDDTNP